LKKLIYAVLGDYYHEHNTISKSLHDAVRPFETEVEVREIETADLSAVLSQNPDLIIALNRCRGGFCALEMP
jgi:hypothetical protein